MVVACRGRWRQDMRNAQINGPYAVHRNVVAGGCPHHYFLHLVGHLSHVGHLGQDVLGERALAYGFEPEMERVEVASERVVLAVEGDRAAYEPEEVLHGDEVAHLLAGDSQERPLPGAHFVLVLL